MECSRVQLLVYVLVICFGMGSWIAINGMFAELPILVNDLPEGWNLPSYMSVIVQVANIGPLLYTMLNRFSPDKVNEKSAVVVMVTVGSASLLLLVFFWKGTSRIGSEDHSTAFLTLLLFMSLMDCTSNVVFLPFMALFRPRYIAALYFGESLSGMVPSFVALGQGVGQTRCVNKTAENQYGNGTVYNVVSEHFPPKFPVEHFFIFLFFMTLLCGVAFALLNYLPACKQEQITADTDIDQRPSTKKTPLLHDNDRKALKETDETSFETENVNATKVQTFTNDEEDEEKPPILTTVQFTLLLVLVAWINAIANGVLPQIESYACLPYGNEPYHLAVNLSNIASPLACVITFWFVLTSVWSITGVTVIATGVTAYVLFLAIGSPNPILVGTIAGEVLVVLTSVLVPFLMTFAKVCAASVFRLQGKRALLWCGIVTQIGSLLGTVAMFVAINVFSVFKQKSECS